MIKERKNMERTKKEEKYIHGINSPTKDKSKTSAAQAKNKLTSDSTNKVLIPYLWKTKYYYNVLLFSKIKV